MDEATITAGGREVRLEGGGDGFRGYLASEIPEEGIELGHLRIEWDEAGGPPVFRLVWTH